MPMEDNGVSDTLTAQHYTTLYCINKPHICIVALKLWAASGDGMRDLMRVGKRWAMINASLMDKVETLLVTRLLPRQCYTAG